MACGLRFASDGHAQHDIAAVPSKGALGAGRLRPRAPRGQVRAAGQAFPLGWRYGWKSWCW